MQHQPSTFHDGCPRAVCQLCIHRREPSWHLCHALYAYRIRQLVPGETFCIANFDAFIQPSEMCINYATAMCFRSPRYHAVLFCITYFSFLGQQAWLMQGARPLHTAHPSAHVCNTNGTAGQLPPAVAVPTSVRNVDSIGPDQLNKCHRLAPDSPAATSLKSYSNGLLDDATARREQRRPLSAANLQPIGHGGPCATRHYQDGHHLNPSAHKPDDSDAVRSITERAEALLAAHDAQRVAILQDDFAGLDLAPGQRSKHIHSHKHTAKPRHVDNRAHGRKDAQRTAATSQQRAKPLSAEWNHFQQQNQDYGDDAVPAHMAPTSSARCAAISGQCHALHIVHCGML